MIQKDSKIGRTITGRSATIDFPIHIGEPQRRPIVEKDYPYYLDFHDRMVRLAHDCVKAGLKVFVPNVEERLHRRPTETWFHVSDGHTILYVGAEDSLTPIISVTLCLKPSRKHGSGIRLKSFSHGKYGEFIDECTVDDVQSLLNRPQPYTAEYHWTDLPHWEAAQGILGPRWTKYQAHLEKQRQSA